jgi:hypothetical protein
MWLLQKSPRIVTRKSVTWCIKSQGGNSPKEERAGSAELATIGDSN